MLLRPVLMLSCVAAAASAALLRPSAPTPRARCARAAVADPADTSLLGQVLAVSSDGLIAIQPEERELAKVGVMLRFGGGTTGVILAERCGLYFAGALDGAPPAADEPAVLLPHNLTVPRWDGDEASWGGVRDYLGRRAGEDAAAALTAEAAAADGAADVFGQPVPQARRRPIGASLHTGVVAIDALAPIGRGQSMMLFGPDSLPAGSGRTDLALRIVRAQRELQSGVRSVLVLCEPDAAARAAARDALRDAGALESVRVLEATTPLEALIAASAACTMAEGCGDDDVLVVVDSLRPHLAVWRDICRQLSEANVPVSPEEEGSQQRQYYSRLVERAARRKEGAAGGGSVTLLLLQPSVSVLPSDAAVKSEYTLADFEAAGFTKTVCSRVAMLESKGVKLSQEVCARAPRVRAAPASAASASAAPASAAPASAAPASAAPASAAPASTRPHPPRPRGAGARQGGHPAARLGPPGRGARAALAAAP